MKIICETADGTTQTRSFLLDAGRIQLDPIKQAFRLATVELMMGKWLNPLTAGRQIAFIVVKGVFLPARTVFIVHPLISGGN